MDPQNPQNPNQQGQPPHGQGGTPSHPQQPPQQPQGQPYGQQGGQYPPPQYPQQGGYGQQQQPPPPQYQPPPPQYPPQQPPQYQQYQQYPQYQQPPKKSGSGLIWALLGLLLVALIGGGTLLFFLLQPKTANNSTVVTSPTSTTAAGVNTPIPEPTTGGPTGSDNADLLKAATDNMRNLRSYRLEADVTSGGQNVTMRGDVDIQNNSLRLDMTAVGQEISLVSVGGTYYLSTDGGVTFTEAPAESAASLESGFSNFNTMWQQISASDIDRARDKLKDGSPPNENIEGDPTKHMIADMADLASLSTGAAGATEGTLEFWVTTGNPGYVRQMVIDGTSSGNPVQATMRWSDFNQDFNITAP